MSNSNKARVTKFPSNVQSTGGFHQTCHLGPKVLETEAPLLCVSCIFVPAPVAATAPHRPQRPPNLQLGYKVRGSTNRTPTPHKKICLRTAGPGVTRKHGRLCAWRLLSRQKCPIAYNEITSKHVPSVKTHTRFKRSLFRKERGLLV